MDMFKVLQLGPHCTGCVISHAFENKKDFQLKDNHLLAERCMDYMVNKFDQAWGDPHMGGLKSGARAECLQVARWVGAKAGLGCRSLEPGIPM